MVFSRRAFTTLKHTILPAMILFMTLWLVYLLFLFQQTVRQCVEINPQVNKMVDANHVANGFHQGNCFLDVYNFRYQQLFYIIEIEFILYISLPFLLLLS
jgi:hypothetical protein